VDGVLPSWEEPRTIHQRTPKLLDAPRSFPWVIFLLEYIINVRTRYSSVHIRMSTDVRIRSYRTIILYVELVLRSLVRGRTVRSLLN
jgi:hypothetical protein